MVGISAAGDDPPADVWALAAEGKGVPPGRRGGVIGAGMVTVGMAETVGRMVETVGRMVETVGRMETVGIPSAVGRQVVTVGMTGIGRKGEGGGKGRMIGSLAVEGIETGSALPLPSLSFLVISPFAATASLLRLDPSLVSSATGASSSFFFPDSVTPPLKPFSNPEFRSTCSSFSFSPSSSSSFVPFASVDLATSTCLPN